MAARRGTRVIGVALAAVLACVFTTATGASVVVRTEAVVDAAKPPARWDERVADLADFVEKTRRLRFKHPVSVRFLSENRFKNEVVTAGEDLNRQEEQSLEQAAGFLRALGLIDGDAKDLLEALSTVKVAKVLAFYDFDEKKVLIRGRHVDLPTRVTVVHELTHALQDQHFDLKKLQAKSGGNGAAIALIEGDALRIQHKYLSTLTHSDQEEYREVLAGYAAGAQGAEPLDVPAVLEIFSEAPYTLGPSFVEAIVSARDEQGIDAAFHAPPTSDKQVLTPSAYLNGDQPKLIAPPSLTAGETRVGKPGTLGALTLYLALATRIGPAAALPVIDAWAGDALVQFQRGTTTCIRGRLVGTEPAAIETIAGALEQWANLAPPDAVSVERAIGIVTFTACDPGQPPAHAVAAAGSVLEARAAALIVEVDRHAPLDRALCVANQAPFDPDLQGILLQANPTPDEIGRSRDKLTSFEIACGVS